MSAKPDPFRSLTKIIKGIQERLVRLENAPRFFNTGLEVVDPGQLIQSGSITIPDNGLLLVDGGDVIMLNESMVEVFRIGVMPNGDRGIQFKRSDGSVAFEVRDTLGLGVQSVAVRDASGALIAGTGLFQNGLGSPWIPIEWTPVDYTSGALAQSTSAATFTATHEHRGYKQNNVVQAAVHGQVQRRHDRCRGAPVQRHRGRRAGRAGSDAADHHRPCWHDVVLAVRVRPARVPARLVRAAGHVSDPGARHCWCRVGVCRSGPFGRYARRPVRLTCPIFRPCAEQEIP